MLLVITNTQWEFLSAFQRGQTNRPIRLSEYEGATVVSGRGWGKPFYSLTLLLRRLTIGTYPPPCPRVQGFEGYSAGLLRSPVDRRFPFPSVPRYVLTRKTKVALCAFSEHWRFRQCLTFTLNRWAANEYYLIILSLGVRAYLIFMRWGIDKRGESMFKKERGGSSEERDLLLSTLASPQIQRGTYSSRNSSKVKKRW